MVLGSISRKNRVDMFEIDFLHGIFGFQIWNRILEFETMYELLWLLERRNQQILEW